MARSIYCVFRIQFFLISALAILCGCDTPLPSAIPTPSINSPELTFRSADLTPTVASTSIAVSTASRVPAQMPNVLSMSTTISFASPMARRLVTMTPTPPIYAVPKQNGILNVRAGPSLASERIGQILVNTPFIVLATNSDATWSLIQLDDGSEGWVLSALITLKSVTLRIPTMSTPQLTVQAQFGTAISLTQIAFAPQAIVTAAVVQGNPTHRSQVNRTTDVLAYCDDPAFGVAQHKTFNVGDPIVVYWAWVAQTRTQIQDHLASAQYAVTIDGDLIANWSNFVSPIISQRQADGSDAYIVYWFIPLDKPVIGVHHIVYQVTWLSSVFDGKDNFGPGTSILSNNGTCSFTVNP